MKKAQKDDLTKEFAKIKEEKKEFKRKTRKEKAKQKEEALDAAIAEEEANEVVDVYDMAAEKDILGQFNAEWLSALGDIKKWNEKKEKLD